MSNFIRRISSNAPCAAGRFVLALVAISVLLFLVAPVIAVMPMSFSSSVTFELLPKNPGFDQYRSFFTSPDWMLALTRSLQVGIGTTIVATTLGTLAALGIFRMTSRWRSVL